MKLTVFFLTAAFLNVQASGISQSVTFSGKNVALETVFSVVKKQTGYVFLFPNKVLDKAKPVTVEAVNIPLADFLETVFRNQPLKYLIGSKTINVSPYSDVAVPSNGQPGTPETDLLKNPFTLIRFRISDSLGVPLQGASVLNKNTGKSGVTDSEGVFSVSVSEGDVVVVSYIGFLSQSITITKSVLTNATLSVFLKPAISKLEDIHVTVNTGYQAIPKERATGSFEFLNSKQLNSRVSTSVLEQLDGKVSGLLFDRRSGTKLHIRGINSFTYLEPLIIVDNFPYYGTIESLDPNDIESVTVLKDAAAASIWGAKAGNGVIVITRKKPTSKQEPSLNFSSSIMFVDPPDLDYVKNLSGPELMDVERWLFDQGHYSAVISNPNTRTTILSPQVKLLDSLSKNLVTQDYVNEQISIWKQHDIKNDYRKYFYRTAITQQYSLNLSGAGNNHSYLLSGGYMNGLAAQAGGGSERWNLRALITVNPLKNLEVSAEMSAVSSKSESGTFYGYPMQGIWPYARLVDDDGNALAIPRTYNPGYVDTVGGGKLLDWHFRPYDEINNSTVENSSLHNNVLLKIGYKPVNGLELSLIYKHEKQASAREFLKTEASYYTRDLINQFTQISGENIKYIVPRGGILEYSNDLIRGNDIRGQLSYNYNWRLLHQFNFLGGAEASDQVSNSRSNIFYGYDSELKTNVAVDPVTRYPLLGGGLGTIPGGGSGLEMRNRRVSFFSNLSYSYKQKYIVTASARRDAANIYGVSTNQKWKPLWSGGMAWLLSEEQFMKQTLFDNLKLRVTYGRSGNAGAMSAKTKIYIVDGGSVDQYSHAIIGGITQPPNPDLKWEQVAMLNTGLDFSLWNRKLFGSVEYYLKKSTDLIASFSTDPTTGFSQVNKNIAVLNGRGIDVQLGSDILRQGVKWTVSGSVSYVKDVVEKFYGYVPQSADYLVSATDPGSFITPMEGYQLYSVFSLRSAGLNPQTGSPRGYIGNEISENYAGIFKVPIEELRFHGTALPRVHGFLNQNFSWKSFSLSVSLTYKFDYYFRRTALSYVDLFGNYKGHPDFNKRWQQPGDEASTRIPSMVYPAISSRDAFYAWSEDNILKGDQIKLRDIRLSYQHLLNVGRGKRPARLELYGTIGNVGLLWTANDERLDADYRGTPPSKNYSVGIRADF